MPQTCVLCTFYRPDTEPRDTVDGGPCPADRARLERDLLTLPGLFARLADGEGDTDDDRWFAERDDDGHPTGQLRRCDPVAARLPAAGAIAARVHKASVTGSKDNPLPLNVDAVDLTAPPRAGGPLGDPADQIGYLPVATILDDWALHVRDRLHPDFHRPAADVPALVAFLHRLFDDICLHLGDVLPDFAAALRSLGGTLRLILRDVEPTPQPLLGVRCEHCRLVSTLVPWSDLTYVECRACGQLYSAAERVAMGRRQLAETRLPRLVILNGLLPGVRPAAG